MILDGDLTMPPEQLPKFWEAIHSQKREFINGSRLTHPMEHESMRFLNLVARFSHSFSPGSSGSGSLIHYAAPRFCADQTMLGSKSLAVILATGILICHI
jgi:hypothetical protein